jgi:hypothetical protein
MEETGYAHGVLLMNSNSQGMERLKYSFNATRVCVVKVVDF